MSALKNLLSAATSLTSTALNALVNGGFANAGTITFADGGGKTPIDCLVTVAVPVGTIGGLRQVLVYIQQSYDGTTYTSGPTSGTTATDEPNLVLIGAIPTGSPSATHRGTFSIAAAVLSLPHTCRVVIKNDSGAALGSDGTVHYQTVIGDIT